MSEQGEWGVCTSMGVGGVSEVCTGVCVHAWECVWRPTVCCVCVCVGSPTTGGSSLAKAVVYPRGLGPTPAAAPPAHRSPRVTTWLAPLILWTQVSALQHIVQWLRRRPRRHPHTFLVSGTQSLTCMVTPDRGLSGAPLWVGDTR